MLILPENKPVMLLSCFYNKFENKAVLRFYDAESEQIYYWLDATNHKPYCYTTLDNESLLNGYKTQLVEKFDVLQDKRVKMLKVIGDNPKVIGGDDNSIRNKMETWEGWIRYHESYLYDNALVCGTYYVRKDNRIEPFEYETKNKQWKEAYTEQWSKILAQPIPNFRRIAIDIEVETGADEKLPLPEEHKNKITAIGLVGSDGLKKVYVTARPNDDGKIFPEMEVCNNERELLQKAFSIIKHYPIVLTFNGDNFDIWYLVERAQDPSVGIARNEIPFEIRYGAISTKKFGVKQAEAAGLKHGVHIDLYRFFSNKTIQVYAYGNKYKEHGLNDVAEGLLGEKKVEHEASFNEMTTHDLAFYCLKDTELTLKLTSFDDHLTMKLMIIIARISRMAIDDLTRLGVNQWIRSTIYFEHRQANELIPLSRELELKGGASTTAMIDGKKYQGALVIEPKKGIYFRVVVIDFASLYPSIIKIWNLSHETVRCNHEQCKTNIVPGTTHWVCKERVGTVSRFVGALRDLRVEHFKKLGKDATLPPAEKNLYGAVEQAIKVILNASYGVIGAEIFDLYCVPVPDCVTAVGRNSITSTIEKARSLGVRVEYSDTDSLFLNNPSKEQVDAIIEWTKRELKIDIEVDKEYRYVAFSGLKKNYCGVFKSGKLDVKGLTGKKSHTPQFIKSMFNEITGAMLQIQEPKDIEPAKEKFKVSVRTAIKRLKEEEIELAELASRQKINKELDQYGREGKNGEKVAIPQHIKAAMELQAKTGKEFGAGSKIQVIKTKKGKKEEAKPLELATWNDINKHKYIEMIESVTEQVLTCFDMEFLATAGFAVQQTL